MTVSGERVTLKYARMSIFRQWKIAQQCAHPKSRILVPKLRLVKLWTLCVQYAHVYHALYRVLCILSYCILGVKSDKFSHNTAYSTWICKINVFCVEFCASPFSIPCTGEWSESPTACSHISTVPESNTLHLRYSYTCATTSLRSRSYKCTKYITWYYVLLSERCVSRHCFGVSYRRIFSTL